MKDVAGGGEGGGVTGMGKGEKVCERKKCKGYDGNRRKEEA